MRLQIWVIRQMPCLAVAKIRKPTPSDLAGYKVVLVSSGAIGVGCQRLKLAARPKSLAQKQALAAMGQVYLIRYWEDFLDALGLV